MTDNITENIKEFINESLNELIPDPPFFHSTKNGMVIHQLLNDFFFEEVFLPDIRSLHITEHVGGDI